LEYQIKGDPTKIKEVIINLLSNAVKFTSSSGAINVDIRRVDSGQDGITRIHFKVEDSGIGVTGEQKARIFDAFSQADTSITRKYGGTGLGLTISSRFIELMGGELDLHSEPGKGTTFFFTLDFEQQDRAAQSCAGAYKGISALIMESSHKAKQQERYLREYLEFYGVSFKTFRDMGELKAAQKEQNYDLVVVDYDYANEESLKEYSTLPQELILLTKSYFMKKIESLELNTFKTIYEPLNNSKIKQALENYSNKNFGANKAKKVSQKKFNADTSKFNANVLVAEDNIINQKLIKRTLEDLGLRVTVASNGLEAFQKRKDGNFDLIFMDIQMPYLDGMEATKEIIEYEEVFNQPHIPIVALTANALKGDREKFIAAGLDEYTTKPLIRAEIISLLNHFLDDFIEEAAPKSEEGLNEEFEAADTQSYRADILLAKKSGFEAKLYAQLLSSLGYSYEIANSSEELSAMIEEGAYRVILLDKELQNLELLALSKAIKNLNSKSGLYSSIVLIIEASSLPNNDDAEYVDEIIKNVANKDLLRLVIEKFIQGK